MKKIIAILILMSMIFSPVSIFKTNVLAAGSSVCIDFDEEDEDSFLPDENYQSGGNYDVSNMSLSSDYDNTTGLGQSLKAENRTALNDRMKLMNIFTPEHIGKKFTVSLWVYIPDLDGAELSFGVYGARGTANTAKSTATVTKVIEQDTWTYIEFDYEHLDELNTQVGIEQKSGEIASTIYIDDLIVLEEGTTIQKDTNTDENVQHIGSTIEPEYAKIIKKFTALGLCDELTEGFDAEKIVTRSEVAGVIYDFVGKNVISNIDDIPYTDISETSKNASEIYALTNLKYLNGFPDGTFRPNEDIYLIDALKVMCTMLGYDIYADTKGGYPTGYLSVSSSIGLIEGISGPLDDKLTSGNLLKLLDNFIAIDILDQVEFGTTGKYKTEDGMTILAKNFDIYCDNGQVKANFKTSLDSTVSLSKTQAKIDGNIYYAGNTDVHDYLGYYVDFYYTNTKNDKCDLLYVSLEEGTYDEIVINGEDKGSIIGGRLYYYNEDNKEKSVAIEFDADVIYNGVNHTFNSSLIENITDGFIKFLDADLDGTYETIFINDVSYFVVENVSPSINTISFKYDVAPIVIESDDVSSSHSITDKYGNDIALDSIKEWNVLSVLKSYDTQAIQTIVSQDAVSGIISSIKRAENGIIEEFTIDGTVYKTTYTMQNLMLNSKIPEPVLGNNITVYLNEQGMAVTWRQNNSWSGQLGYIYEAGVEETSRRGLFVKMICDDGEFKEYKFASKVKIDGISTEYKNIDTTQFYNNDDTVRKLVNFEVNSDGEIKEINFPLSVSNIQEGKLTQTLTSQSGYVKRGVINYFSTPGTSSTSTVFSISDDTVAFKIPQDEKNMSKKEYYAVSRGDMTVIPTHPVVADIYTFKGSYNLCDVLVYKSEYASVVNVEKTYPTLITGFSTIIADDGEIYTKVTGINNGNEVSFLYEDLREGTPTVTLSVGDIVLYNTNEKGIVTFKGAENATSSTNTSIRILVDYNASTKDITRGYIYSAKTSSTISSTFAVHSISDGYIYLNTLEAPDNANPLQAYKYSDFTVYKFNKSKSEFELAAAVDVVPFVQNPTSYTKAYMYIRNTMPSILVYY